MQTPLGANRHRTICSAKNYRRDILTVERLEIAAALHTGQGDIDIVARST